MALRDILVCIDTSARNAANLALACDMARRHGAHLTGLCSLEMLLPPMADYSIGPVMSGAVLSELMGQFREQGLAQAAELEAAFTAAADGEGVAATWRLLDGPEAPLPPVLARTADLAILGQPTPQESSQGPAWELVEDMLFASARPVLVVPYAGSFPSCGRHVLIAWNGSVEGARAVQGALPLIRSAGRVTILSVVRPSEIDPKFLPEAVDLAVHLARHGVAASVARSVNDELADADAILDFAADSGADLLVSGAYGQSRLREMMLGGVSRSLLRHMTLPVLMAH